MMRRRPLLRTVAVALLAALLAVGCGGEAERFVTPVVPAKAGVVLVLDVPDAGDERSGWAHLDKALDRVPAWRALHRPGPDPGEVAAMLAGAVGIDLDWERDVATWIGGEAGVAAWGVPEVGRDPVEGIAWADLSREKESRDRARRSLARLVGDDGRERIGDVEVLHGARGGGRRLWWTVLDDRVVVASHEEAMRSALAAASGDALERRGIWRLLREERARNRGSRIATLIVTPLGVAQARRVLDRTDLDLDALLEGGGLGMRGGAPWLDASSATWLLGQLVEHLDVDAVAGRALQVGATERGIWIDAVTVGDVPERRARNDAAQRALERAPIDAAFALVWVDGRLVSWPVAERLGARVDALDRLVGDDATRDELAVATGRRGMVAAWPSGGESGGTALGVAFDVTDRATAEGVVEVIAAALGDLARVLADDRGAGVEIARVEGDHTVGDDDALVVVGDDGALDELAAAWREGRDTLSATPGLARDLTSTDPPATAAVLWRLDVARVVYALEPWLAQRIDARALPLLRAQGAHLGVVGWVVSERHGELILTRAVVELPTWR